MLVENISRRNEKRIGKRAKANLTKLRAKAVVAIGATGAEGTPVGIR